MVSNFDFFSALFTPRLLGDVFLHASFWVCVRIDISDSFSTTFFPSVDGEAASQASQWRLVLMKYGESIPHFFRFLYITARRICVFALFFWVPFFLDIFEKTHRDADFLHAHFWCFFSTLYSFFPIEFRIRMPGARFLDFNVKWRYIFIFVNFLSFLR